MTAELTSEKDHHLATAHKLETLDLDAASLHRKLADAVAQSELSESRREASAREAAELAAEVRVREEGAQAQRAELEALRTNKVGADRALSDVHAEVTPFRPFARGRRGVRKSEERREVARVHVRGGVLA